MLLFRRLTSWISEFSTLAQEQTWGWFGYVCIIETNIRTLSPAFTLQEKNQKSKLTWGGENKWILVIHTAQEWRGCVSFRSLWPRRCRTRLDRRHWAPAEALGGEMMSYFFSLHIITTVSFRMSHRNNCSSQSITLCGVYESNNLTSRGVGALERCLEWKVPY